MLHKIKILNQKQIDQVLTSNLQAEVVDEAVLQVDREVVVKEDLKEEVKGDQVEVRVEQEEEDQEVVLQVAAEQVVKEEFLEEEQELTGVDLGEGAILDVSTT